MEGGAGIVSFLSKESRLSNSTSCKYSYSSVEAILDVKEIAPYVARSSAKGSGFSFIKSILKSLVLLAI